MKTKTMMALFAVAAVLAVFFISGCTQNPPVPSGNGGTGGSMDKSAEDKAAAALEGEVDQAVANMSEQDLENALLNQ
jgi:outer membrane lipoprotein-sorting protein